MSQLKRVLAVDDSSVVRQILKKTLGDAGYEVTEAVDGTDALGKIASHPYDMVITDLNMPNMDGISLVKNVRQQPGNRFIPILMLTTETQQQVRDQGKTAGASAWLVKPFQPEKLLAIVSTILN